MSTFKIKENRSPRCSVNKLGEYVSQQSSPARRREIVKSQKFPPTYKVVKYTPATRLLVDSLANGYDDEKIQEAIGEFYKELNEATNEPDRTQARCSISALQAFRKLIGQLGFLADCSLTPGPQTWAIDLAGVTVSLRPELFVEFEAKNGVRQIGFIKFYFSKTHQLDEHAAGVINSVMLEKARQSMPTASISNTHVVVIDVFSGKYFTAPARQKRLLNEAIAACEEIAHSWARYLAS